MRVRKLFELETKFEASKLRDAGFVSEVSIPEGIARMTRWYLETGRHRKPIWRIPPRDIQRY